MGIKALERNTKHIDSMSKTPSSHPSASANTNNDERENAPNQANHTSATDAGLWDTSSLYNSQLSIEDLLWTDWFNSEGLKGEDVPHNYEDAAQDCEDLEKRILHRSYKGCPRRSMGSNLLPLKIKVALWCDGMATMNALKEKHGAIKYNPTTLVSESQTFVSDFKRNAARMGTALQYKVLAPLPWKTVELMLKEGMASVGTLANSAQAKEVEDMLIALKQSEIVYSGLWGLSIPNINLRVPRITAESVDPNKKNVYNIFNKWLNSTQKNLTEVINHFSDEYVREGTSLVLDWKEKRGTYHTLDTEYNQKDETRIDILAIAPPDKFGRRATIKLGSAPAPQQSLPSMLLENAMVQKDPTGKNYIALGVGYTINNFQNMKWMPNIPQWRQYLRNPKTLTDRVMPSWIRKNILGQSSRRPELNKNVANLGPTMGLLKGECLPGMSFLSTNFEMCDLRAGNPIPMVIQRKQKSFNSAHRWIKYTADRRYLYQLY